MVILESIKSAHTRVSNVLSSISEYAKDSFKENSCAEERKVFVQMLVAVLYEGGDGKNRETFPRIPDEPSKPRNFSPSKLMSFTVYNNQSWW